MSISYKNVTILGLVTVALTGCFQEASIPKAKTTIVDTYTVGQPIENRFRQLQGIVTPTDLTPLSFRVEGKVNQIFVSAGDQVKKGQVIAQLDDTKLKQKLDDALAQYNLTTNQYSRSKQLSTQNMISASQLDELAANQSLASVQYKHAKQQLSYSTLMAPFDGVIAELPFELFENVNPGETFAYVYYSSKAYVDVPVSDSFLATFLALENYHEYQPQAIIGSRSQPTKLEYVEHSTELVPSTQAYQIRYVTKQDSTPVLPGESVSLKIDLSTLGLNSQNAYTLPVSVLQAGDEPNQFYVWKLIESKAQKAAVNVDQLSTDGAHIVSGITQNDVLISTQINTLREGMHVTTVNQITSKTQGANE